MPRNSLIVLIYLLLKLLDLICKSFLHMWFTVFLYVTPFSLVEISISKKPPSSAKVRNGAIPPFPHTFYGVVLN
jgi:hypothetical protein